MTWTWLYQVLSLTVSSLHPPEPMPFTARAPPQAVLNENVVAQRPTLQQLKAFERPVEVAAAAPTSSSGDGGSSGRFAAAAAAAASALTVPAASAAEDGDPSGTAIRALYGGVKAKNTQLAAALILPLLAYKVGAIIQGFKLRWYLDVSIALSVVAFVAYVCR